MPRRQPCHGQHPGPGPVSLSGLWFSFPFMDLCCRSQFMVQHKSQRLHMTFKSRRVGMRGDSGMAGGGGANPLHSVVLNLR